MRHQCRLFAGFEVGRVGYPVWLAGKRLRRLPIYLLLLLGAAVMLFPFLWMVSTSLTEDFALFATPPELVPSPVEEENYSRLSELVPIWRFALNSVAVAAIATALQVLTSAMGAYAFSRLHFRGRDALSSSTWRR